jgi:hypothetical protein
VKRGGIKETSKKGAKKGLKIAGVQTPEVRED